MYICICICIYAYIYIYIYVYTTNGLTWCILPRCIIPGAYTFSGLSRPPEWPSNDGNANISTVTSTVTNV